MEVSFGDAPLVVGRVERAGVPRVDDAVRPPAAWLSRGQAKLCLDAVLAQPVRELDAAPYRASIRSLGPGGLPLQFRPAACALNSPRKSSRPVSEVRMSSRWECAPAAEGRRN
jgi:hypothetical protein